MKLTAVWPAILALLAVRAVALDYPPSLPDAHAEVYKTVGETKLSLYIFEPPSGPKRDRPAIVFFFGGGWVNGSPEQFAPHCRYLAARGMVAITADYRVASRHQVKPTACVADAKSAVRWLRGNAARLGLDPRRIAAGGGSAGGHLAAAAALLPGLDEPGENREISPVPDALVLFNPALALASLDGYEMRGFAANHGPERLGADPVALSPAHHVRPEAPPTIIFHGRADKTVPFASVEAFARAMRAAGNRCELIGYEGKGHGFFNYGNGDNSFYQATVVAMDGFLVSLGYLAPAGTSPAVPHGSANDRP